MAINIPIISEFSDAGIKAAKAAFGNFKTAVADAEGGMGKFKAGSKVAFDAVAANAGTFALAAGATIGKFVADGITAFQDLALGAGKFADATGLAVEDASRYIEAAGDIGIPVDAVEAAIGRLNKTIGADPDKVRNLGVDLVYLKDGSLDVNETFKNTIDRIKGIKDPAEKAKVATQLLGKGWQTMAVLIEDGSAKLDESLRKVSDQKIITEAELKMAEDYRDAMNNLGDATEDVKVKSGQRLIPMITFLANGASAALDLDTKVTELFKDIVGNGTQAVEPISDLAGVLDEGRINAGSFKTAIQQAKTPLDELTTSASNATVAIVNADTAWRDLTEQFNEVVALDKATEALGKMEAAAAEAFATGAYDDLVTYNEKAAEFMEILAEISGQMDGISSKEILIRFQTQGPAAALELAGYLARGAEYGGLSAADALGLAGISTGSNNINGRFRGPRALGGPVAPGGSYLVGERGPELFTPSSSGNITPNGAMGGINITVNAGMGTDGTTVGQAIVQEINRYARSGGTRIDRRVL